MPRVRLPCTSTRKYEYTCITLIERLRPERHFAAQIFEGKHFKGGRYVEEAELWPSPYFPSRPLLVEFGGIATAGWGKQRPSSHWHLLWRFNALRHAFEEIVRVETSGGEWVHTLVHLAKAELNDDRREARETAERSFPRAAEIIETELDKLDGVARSDYLQMLSTFLENKIINVGD